MAPFDYASLLNSDPVLQQAIASANNAAQQAQLTLQAQRRAALIQYGSVPNLDQSQVGNIAPDIDQGTRDLAQQATDSGLSTLGQLRKAYEDSRGASDSNLASRNALHSGDYRRLAREDLSGYQTNQANAANALNSQLAGDWGTYTGAQQTSADSIGSATAAAEQRISTGIASGALSYPTPATPVPPKAAPALGPRSYQTARNSY